MVCQLGFEVITWQNPQPKAYTDYNPSNFVEQWNTPIMVIQGGMDFRVPYEQGQEAFQAAENERS